MQNWIKCSERMPEEYVYVLIYTRHPDEILMAHLTKNNHFCFDRDNDGEEMICDATHWQPLPEPPNE